MLHAALNGNRAPGSHPALPLTLTDLVADGRSCVRAGAAALHIHPRSSSSGLETLDPTVVDETVLAVRAATGVPIGVSTGAWIEPDLARRAEAVSSWREPDMASVNFSEDGAELVTEALLEAGIRVEAGIWSVADAERLAVSGFAHRLVRVLVEIVHPTEHPIGAVIEIEAALARLGIDAPILVHGEGAAAWPVMRHGLAHGLDIRIGLEDSLHLPHGAIAASNAALVEAALELMTDGPRRGARDAQH